MNIRIRPKKVFYYLLAIIGILLIAHIIGYIAISRYKISYELMRYVNFDSERNFPSYYSSIILLFCSVFLYYIGKSHKENGSSYLPWYGLSIIFLFLAIDENIMIHESIILPVRRLLRSTGFLSLPSLSWITSNTYILNAVLIIAWIIPYSISAFILGLVYIRFIKTLPSKTSLLFVESGFIYILGAIGFELLGGFDKSVHGEPTMYYLLFLTIEETLEMLGISIFVYALLSYISENIENINIKVDK